MAVRAMLLVDSISVKLSEIERQVEQVCSFKRKFHMLNSAMNKIAILGSGPHAYSSDFTEHVNMIARSALTEVEKLK